MIIAPWFANYILESKLTTLTYAHWYNLIDVADILYTSVMWHLVFNITYNLNHNIMISYYQRVLIWWIYTH